MRYVLETITPKKAERLLSKNVENRPIRKSWVDRLASDIVADRWVVTHQGIALDTRGVLIDGQHRLMAVIQAGIAVKMWVAYEENTAARIAIDQGGGRNVRDISGVLCGLDHQVTNDEAATGRQMYCSIARGNFALNQSNQEKLQYIIKHREAIRFAGDHVKGDARHACFRAVVARAWYTQDRERLVQFCQMLSGGVLTDKRDVAAHKLRTYWLNNKKAFNGAAGRAELYRKTEMALRAFLARRLVDKICEIESEIYPIPGDEGTDGDSPGLFDVPADGPGPAFGAQRGHGQAWAARSHNNS